jgi:tight adherence protein B
MMSGFIGPATILAAVLLLGPVVLLLEARERRILQRVSAVEAQGQGSMALPEQSIRRGGDRLRRLRQLLRDVFCYDAEIRVAYTVPVLLVIVAGMAAGTVAGVVGTLALPSTACILIGVAVGCLATRGLFGWQRGRYRNSLLKQIPDALSFAVSALRVGIPLVETFRGIAREMPEPTRSQFVQVLNEVALGQPVHAALLNLYHRTMVTEYAIFAVTVAVQTKSGGHLAETIERLAETVRERILIGARADALAGEGKVSAMILGALPVVAALALSLIRPGYLDPLIHDPRGRRLLLIGIALLVTGILTMRHLIVRAVRQ